MRGCEDKAGARKNGAGLFLTGLAMLAAGGLFYALVRPAESAQFLPAALSLHLGRVPLPPALAGALPSFLHALAFSLMSLALVLRSVRARIAACITWATIEILFEFAQYPPFGETVGLRMAGVFDPLDIVAALAGAAVAFAAVHTLRAVENSPT